jgi:hypothetical protein
MPISCLELHNRYQSATSDVLSNKKKFNDKTYYLMFRARSKEIANVYAESLHTCGYRARMVKADTKFGSMRYSIYARK